MDYSTFIILLGRQRSGTNALRSVLDTHPDIFCFNEVFSIADIDSVEPLIRNSNFFGFLQRYAGGDFRKCLPDRHEQLFLDYLDYLRCFSSKRYLVIDVKYNTTHFLTEPYRWNLAPYLFFLIKRFGMRVLNVTRRNFLRYVVSTVKAEQTGVWALSASDQRSVERMVSIEIDYLLRMLNYCDSENAMIETYFCRYAQYRAAEYDELFPNASGRVAGEPLRLFAEWIGVPASFEDQSFYRKQSHLPLEETISNYDEVANALKGTKFEYCLQDEMLYRRPAPADA